MILIIMMKYLQGWILMGYFRELPDLEYQSFLSDAVSTKDYLTVKNLFRRNKLRDDLQNVFTLFNKYEIVQGARPDTVAEEFYGSADLDWVVLLTAGIINVRNEWRYLIINYTNMLKESMVKQDYIQLTIMKQLKSKIQMV